MRKVLLGILIISKAIHPESASSPMAYSPSGKSIRYKCEQPWKTCLESELTPSGILTLRSAAQPAKACSPKYWSARSRDTLVACKIEVHQRILDILRLIAGIIVRAAEFDRRL